MGVFRLVIILVNVIVILGKYLELLGAGHRLLFYYLSYATKPANRRLLVTPLKDAVFHYLVTLFLLLEVRK
ncbi:hypothetical protein COJ46_22000 [Bacillus sp. AFS077874]|nr:hypothetical protein COJ46_22000 [Bacillus sp. AFS077874]